MAMDSMANPIPAAAGAFYNVKINLPGIRDDIFKEEVLKKVDELMSEVARLGADIKAVVELALSKT
jgi:formiminotetrahydrofolate cyclodeaminase